MGANAQDRVIRIGGASAFLIDSALAVPQLLRGGGLDYLIFDYLAEGSMGLLGRMQAADPKGGFGADFLSVHVGPHLREIARQGIKVIANAGGLNPQGLAAATEALLQAQGLDLKVACVDGDDIREQVAARRCPSARSSAPTSTSAPSPLPQRLPAAPTSSSPGAWSTARSRSVRSSTNSAGDRTIMTCSPPAPWPDTCSSAARRSPGAPSPTGGACRPGRTSASRSGSATLTAPSSSPR